MAPVIPPHLAYLAPIDLLDVDGLSSDAQRSLASLLDSEEQMRAGRFVFPADRARFLLAHAAVRRLLGQLLGCAPAAVQFHRGAYGKPALASGSATGDPGIFFNLSHSRRMALVAWAGVEVGVDVEDTDREIDELGVGEQVFSRQEQQALASRPPGPARRAAFYTLWTRKEAILKALGTGFSRNATEIDLGPRLDDDRPFVWSDGLSGQAWTVAGVNVGPGHKAAIAVKGDSDDLRTVWSRLLDNSLVPGARAGGNAGVASAEFTQAELSATLPDR